MCALHGGTVFMKQPKPLEIQPQIIICGDIHGQCFDLLRIFDKIGYPPSAHFLFLGDYFYRGTIAASKRTVLLYNEHFLAPITLVIHGGLSPEKQTLEDTKRLQRPTDVPEHRDCFAIWSGWTRAYCKWVGTQLKRYSFAFGEVMVKKFLRKYGFELIFGSHELIQDGFRVFAEKKLISVFSATNNCGEFDNAGAVVSVDNHFVCSFIVIPPDLNTVHLLNSLK